MDCIFCKIVSGEIKSRFLKETKYSISFLDAFPLAAGHVLVIPKNHYQKIQDMSIEENNDIFSLVHQMVSNMDAITESTLIAIHNGKDAGQEIPHVHVHLVPRSKDDSAGAIHTMFDSTATPSELEMDELYEKLKI
ncbi:HIT family protein [archaeon]|nr:HIT family protein [archaeon]